MKSIQFQSHSRYKKKNAILLSQNYCISFPSAIKKSNFYCFAFKAKLLDKMCLTQSIH